MKRYASKSARQFKPVLAALGAATLIAASLIAAYNSGTAYASENRQVEPLAYGMQQPPSTPTPIPDDRLYLTPMQAPAPENEKRSASDRSSKRPVINAKITYFYCMRVNGIPAGDGGGFCGYFADGTKVTPEATGNTAACGNGLGMGTMVDIPGYGIIVCRDRGHLDEYQIDLFRYENTPPSSLPLGEREVEMVE